MTELSDADLNAHALALAGWEYAPTSDEAKDRPWRNHAKMQRLAEHQLPSYLTGPEALGNVAELEAMMTDEQLQKYDRWLSWVIVRDDKDEYWTPMRRACTYTWHATPRQRLLALLRVLKPELLQ